MLIKKFYMHAHIYIKSIYCLLAMYCSCYIQEYVRWQIYYQK